MTPVSSPKTANRFLIIFFWFSNNSDMVSSVSGTQLPGPVLHRHGGGAPVSRLARPPGIHNSTLNLTALLSTCEYLHPLFFSHSMKRFNESCHSVKGLNSSQRVPFWNIITRKLQSPITTITTTQSYWRSGFSFLNVSNDSTKSHNLT